VIQLFRVILPVSDIERAAQFYGALLDASGSRVSPGRHYFRCGGVILAYFDPRADGDPWDASPNPDHVYFSVTDLESTLKSARNAGAVILRPIENQP
jgi:predicted enzyme related to lactoylglutathione lyase